VDEGLDLKGLVRFRDCGGDLFGVDDDILAVLDLETLGLQLLRDRLFGLTVDEDAVDAVAGVVVDRVEFDSVEGTRCCVKSCPARLPRT
jgi:hypothetical protein